MQPSCACKSCSPCSERQRCSKQISNATGVALPYKVEWAFHCYNGFGLEQEIHHKLEEYRVNNNREFFQISLDEAKETVKILGKQYI